MKDRGRWLKGVGHLWGALGFEPLPKHVLLIYGEPMVGKSTLAAAIARWWAQRHNTNVTVIGTEASYYEEDFAEVLGRYLGDVKASVLTYTDRNVALRVLLGKRYMSQVHNMGAVIIDSISAITDDVAVEVVMSTGSIEQRPISSRAAPVGRYIVKILKDVVVARNGLGIVIAHAGSTAGTGKYRGVSDYRPSLAIRCGHYVSYMLHLGFWERNREYRKLTVVAARSRPWLEGRSALFRFAENDVEVYVREEQ